MTTTCSFTGSAKQRIGWLLRVNRLYGEHPAHAKMGGFAKDYRRATMKRGAHRSVAPSTISRWETARCGRQTHTTIRTYEQVLGLPPDSLVAVADTVIRYMSSSTTAAPALARMDDPAGGPVVDELVDRARTADVMTGHDWDQLTDLACRNPGMILSPRSAWTDLAQRLLYETSIADGVCWMLRAEALNRLIAHPAATDAVITAVADAAADRGVQSMIGTVSVFEATQHVSAGRYVLAHLTTPVTDRTFFGALLACVRKVRCGHFDPQQLTALLDVLVDVLAGGATDAIAGLVSKVVRTLPVPMQQRINTRVWDLVAAHLDQPALVSHVVDRVCRTTIAGLPREEAFHDTMLPILVAEMLFDPVFDVRLYAAFLLYSTPYRWPLAAAIAHELTIAQRSRNGRWAVTLLQALRLLGGPEQRRQVERLLLLHATPAAMCDTAASALGHISGSSTEVYWRAALTTATTRWTQTRARAEESTLDRLIYALGMADNVALLRTITTSDAVPPAVQRAARWWVTHSAHIRASARS